MDDEVGMWAVVLVVAALVFSFLLWLL